MSVSDERWSVVSTTEGGLQARETGNRVVLAEMVARDVAKSGCALVVPAERERAALRVLLLLDELADGPQSRPPGRVAEELAVAWGEMRGDEAGRPREVPTDPDLSQGLSQSTR